MAEGILAQLKVLIGLDSTKLTAGLDESAILAKKSAGKIQGEFSSLASSIQRLLAPFGNIGGPIAGSLSAVGRSAGEATKSLGSLGGALAVVGGAGVVAAAGLGAGLVSLAIKAADVGAKIFDASQNTGMGAAQMSGMMAVAKEMGGDFDSVSITLARAGANLAALGEHGAKSADKMNLLGRAALAAGDSGAKPLGNRIHDVVKEILSWNNQADRNRALNELLGRSWVNNITTLEAWANAADGGAAAARKFGIYFDDEHARQAKQFTIAIAIMRGELGALGLIIGQTVIPWLTNWMQGIQGLSARWEAFTKVLGAGVALMVGDLDAAKGLWGEYQDASKRADQTQTDFLVNLQNLTQGAIKAGEEGLKPLTGKTKNFSDALAGLIERERDELSEVAIAGNKQRELQAEYDRTTRQIQKLVGAGGSYTESLTAQGLALDIYRAKMLAYIKSLPTTIPDVHRPPAAPSLAMPGAIPGGLLSNFNPIPPALISDLLKLRDAEESAGKRAKFLREEENLSTPALNKLAAAFPNLTLYQIAASEAGEKYIRTLQKMEQSGVFVSAADKFSQFKDQLIADGNDMAGHLIRDLGGALNQIEDQIARLAVTGKRINIKQITQGFAEGVIKSGEQKALSMVLGGFGIHAGGTKPDGTQGNPMWVKLADKAGLGGIFGGAKAGSSESDEDGEGDGDSGGISGIFGKLKGAFSKLGSLFGGFLAEGGDVTPGKAYVVGERHPEFFVPRASGAIVPSLRAQTLTPIHYAPTYNINTPDADSFRRSQSQIAAEGYRHFAMLHARNG